LEALQASAARINLIIGTKGKNSQLIFNINLLGNNMSKLRSLKVKNDTYTMVTKLVGDLQRERGKHVSVDQAISALLAKWTPGH
jgi:hypothetical protein